MNQWDQLDAVVKALLALRRRVDTIEAAQKQAAEADLAQRVQGLEAKLAALLPMVDPDRLEVARVCQRLGVPIATLRGRENSATRAAQVARVFQAIRELGWSFDRVASATHFTARGVQLNLKRFSTGSSATS
jgi:hypothetical protein